MSKTIINSKVVDTDAFLEMPSTSRLLYYDLLLRSDNDGFITPLKVIRLTGASQDDLKILVAKGFAYAWDDGVIVLLHYREHNHVKHYSPSDYWPRLRQVKGKYALGAREDGATLATSRLQDGALPAPQVKLSKDKISKVNTNPLTPKGEVSRDIPMSKNAEELLNYWESTMAPITRNRIFQKNVLVRLSEEHGVDTVKKMIRIAQAALTTEFTPGSVKVSSPKQLEERWDILVLWARSQGSKQESKKVIAIS